MKHPYPAAGYLDINSLNSNKNFFVAFLCSLPENDIKYNICHQHTQRVSGHIIRFITVLHCLSNYYYSVYKFSPFSFFPVTLFLLIFAFQIFSRYSFSIFYPWKIFPVTRFLVTALLVTRYCITRFSNTLGFMFSPFFAPA